MKQSLSYGSTLLFIINNLQVSFLTIFPIKVTISISFINLEENSYNKFLSFYLINLTFQTEFISF